MKYILALLFTVCTAVLCPAQRQTGYVKTPGRLGSGGELIAGQRIAGATLYFRDISTVGSGADGTFTLAVPGKSFMLTRVQKNGYELADRDLLGKTHSTSSEPFIVVMDTPDALLAQRLASERKLRRTLQQQLQAREDEIEALREQQRITEDEYHKKLQELYASQENNEKLISDMAERYARMDFDQLDDFRRRVAACIQNGDLTRADSLLSTRGNLLDRAVELKRGEAALHAYADDLAHRQQAHDKSIAMRAHALADFGTDCYNRAEICQLRHMNDSAAYYLELRANTDTLNAEWQNDAGRFIDYYVGDYDKARLYYNRILQIPSLDDSWKAVAYNNIGTIYEELRHNDYALEYYKQALDIVLVIFDENNPYVAQIYNNIGNIYSSLRKWEESLEYHGKALKIRLDNLGEDHIDVANSYNNIGFIYDSKKEYNKALEYYEKALKIVLDNFGEDYPSAAQFYSNIGNIYSIQGRYDKASEYLEKALKIQVDIFGENHPTTANIYNNIGGMYVAQMEYNKALQNFQKALKIQLEMFGESTTHTLATIYDNIAAIYWAAKAKGKKLPGFDDFISEWIFIGTIAPGNPPAARQGMSGEYTILEFGDWIIDSKESLPQKNEELRGKPKTITVMQNGKITQHHFENVIGMGISYKRVGRAERQRILDEYHKWKALH